ncbi:hypothetical protein J6590_097953 [Homalodisca vitripennis]|nr:hypothetical protein J6590_009805 [Homalodisca vitripennis]KAG8334074.1 hypothetical protein J6590_097953 [Homalodisca vitripennis]
MSARQSNYDVLPVFQPIRQSAVSGSSREAVAAPRDCKVEAEVINTREGSWQFSCLYSYMAATLQLLENINVSSFVTLITSTKLEWGMGPGIVPLAFAPLPPFDNTLFDNILQSASKLDVEPATHKTFDNNRGSLQPDNPLLTRRTGVLSRYQHLDCRQMGQRLRPGVTSFPLCRQTRASLHAVGTQTSFHESDRGSSPLKATDRQPLV